MAPNTAVHRPLALTTPKVTGPDVRNLQGGVNRLFAHYKIDRRVEIDGVLGMQTFDAAHDIATAHGAVSEAQAKFKRHIISEGTQKLIRGRDRTAIEVASAKEREDYRKQLRARYAAAPGELAIQKTNGLVGITENPPGSNWGGKIEEMIRFTGYDEAVYWCGCAACWIVVKVGGAEIPARIRMGFAPYITADALAGRNGFTAVPAHLGRAGDVACIDNGHHIVTLRDDVSATVALTREGNTTPAPGSGDEYNGGGLFDRERPLSLFDAGIVARPAWA